MNVFISGGCKNGKSYYAQREVRQQAQESGRPLYYVATMIPRDDEDRERVRRHIAEREGWGFITVEQGRNLTALLDNDNIDNDGVFLVDSITALLENEMFDSDGNTDESAPERVRQQIEMFAKRTGNTVFVSDYIYSDAFDYSETVELYRKGLAGADRTAAAICDRVIEIYAGMEERWK